MNEIRVSSAFVIVKVQVKSLSVAFDIDQFAFIYIEDIFLHHHIYIYWAMYNVCKSDEVLIHQLPFVNDPKMTIHKSK